MPYLVSHAPFLVERRRYALEPRAFSERDSTDRFPTAPWSCHTEHDGGRGDSLLLLPFVVLVVLVGFRNMTILASISFLASTRTIPFFADSIVLALLSVRLACAFSLARSRRL